MFLQDTHEIRTGAILKCKNGQTWICVGWVQSEDNDSRLSAVFIRDVTGLHGISGVKERMWVRTCSMTKTFEEHYPDASSFIK